MIDRVHRLLKTIDKKKSFGLDKMPNNLLKMAADFIAPSLTEIVAISICTGIFLTEWKEARETPVDTNGAKHEPGNYRPISVIPTVSKIFEKTVFDKLNKYFEQQQSIDFLSVWILFTNILQKLENYGIDDSSLKCFKSYLTGRVNDKLSNSTSVKCGIPKGSNLAPLLFLNYVNDLPNCLYYANPS